MQSKVSRTSHVLRLAETRSEETSAPPVTGLRKPFDAECVRRPAHAGWKPSGFSWRSPWVVVLRQVFIDDLLRWSSFMKIEHVAFNVADPVAVAAWYCEHFGLRIVRHIPQPAQTHFLADPEFMVLEIYCNPPDQVPDYGSMDPLLLHLAFTSLDPTADTKRLIAAGATLVEETQLPDGSHLVMLRDPWGLAVQLCQRAKPLV